MITRSEISYEYATKLFTYVDGDLIWKINKGRRAKAGDIAGNVHPNGRSQVQIDGKLYGVHRIIFLLHNKYLPELVDHIDLNKRNNSIENLRDFTSQGNNRNVGIRKDNTSGVKGISWHKQHGKWVSRITVNKKLINLGIFRDFDEAVLIRWKKEVELDWPGCKSNSCSYVYLKDKGIISKESVNP